MAAKKPKIIAKVRIISAVPKQVDALGFSGFGNTAAHGMKKYVPNAPKKKNIKRMNKSIQSTGIPDNVGKIKNKKNTY